MSECVVVSCADGLHKPIIANFQNGQLERTQVDKLQCMVFKNPKDNKRVIAVASEKMVYVQAHENVEDLCHTLVTVRNKKDNKLRIFSAENISLMPVVSKINESLDITLNLNKSNVSDLNKQFGSKKSKRATEQMERMKMNISNVEHELKQTVADIKIRDEDLVAPRSDENDKFYRPPMNKSASTVDEIYDIQSIITLAELDTLSDLVNEVLEDPGESDKFVPFVIENINVLKAASVPNMMQKCQMLLYINGILKFFKIPVKAIGKKKFLPELDYYPESIQSKILNEFTVFSDNSRSRPISMRDKASCYVIVIALLALNYRVNLESLSKSIGVGVKKLSDVSRILGAQPESSKEKNTIVLKLPLPAIPTSLGKRKR